MFQSWIESLRLFLPKNLKLFVLVAFRAYYLTLKDIVSHMLALLGALVFLGIAADLLQFSIKSSLAWYIGYGVIALHLMLLFLLVLAVRPSIALKTSDYYLHYRWYSVYMYVLFIITFFIPYVPTGIAYSITLGGTIESSLLLPTIMISPLFVGILLFICDSNGSISAAAKAVRQGIMLFIYNYPFCLITFLLLHQYARLISFIYGKGIVLLAHISIRSLPYLVVVISLHQCLFVAISIVGGLFPLIWITNFYIKRIHEQYALYDT